MLELVLEEFPSANNEGETSTTTWWRKSNETDKDDPVISLSLINDQSQDSSSLFSELGRKLSIYCLLHSSRSDYGSIASLNRDFRTLVCSGELYKLRKLMGVTEHWVYMSCNPSQWEAFDPIRLRWMRLPPLTGNTEFTYSDRESLAVGTELLVFDRDMDDGNDCPVYRFCFLTNSWSMSKLLNTLRSLFGFASLGEVAIVAGGCDRSGNILGSAELYDAWSEPCPTWVTLPNMNKPRKMCAGVFMESKFYVIGGIGEDDNELTCGEYYDLKAGTWTEIPNMFPRVQNAPAASKPPPSLAVVKNELYAACFEEREVRKYDKRQNV